MAFATHIHSTAHAGAHHGLLAELQDRIARYRLYRKTVNELAVLNARELADLGLCRAQIRAVAYQAAYGDRA
ncbi:Uncharacterized conserved protein YjiS, DUF1127 family [Lutimaribacter pacificus]|uniref:Uncharacterized conserved protein YjiS, DUF1127 family n=1 Tax=Lutimaribacter pacificus TaxID=391948 RepID=A0A1H0JJC9_9RHOB|nr:DUF1127 domain-containing protein [Lutimaribacter pacificus]SDO43491.1 Uncharacterized conserved protein YjiS, DUF1127 family [Lutimaribacter pacificus]SHK09764.1 Uncharacterized conserved protein YjiS, DUF1127 family [Lutimaribacter pacificus]